MNAQLSGPASNDIPRDAIIYVPGLDFVDNQSIDNITQQIANALEPSSTTKLAKFSVEAASYQDKDGASRAFKYRTIVRNDNGKSTRAMDVYELGYLASFTQDYDNQNPALLLLRMAAVAILNARRLGNLIKSPVKTGKEKAQVFLALLMVSVIVAYMGVLAFAVVDLIRGLPAFQQLGQASPTSQAALAAIPDVPQTTSSAISSLQTSFLRLITLLAQWVVVAVAFIGLVWPDQTENLRQVLQQAAIHYMSLLDYFSASTRRASIEGYFLALLEHLGEKQVPYENIYVITYSFGGVVALDAIFPAAYESVKRVEIITGLVTIGHPYDFFHSLWPEYFEKYRDITRGDLLWLNVYSAVDILGSNFRQDNWVNELIRDSQGKWVMDPSKEATVAEPDPAVMNKIGLSRFIPQNIPYPRDASYEDKGLLEILTFTGLREHAIYFRPVSEGETTCFIAILPKLLKNTDWLK